MSGWIEIVDRHFTPEEFDAYCQNAPVAGMVAQFRSVA